MMIGSVMRGKMVCRRNIAASRMHFLRAFPLDGWADIGTTMENVHTTEHKMEALPEAPLVDTPFSDFVKDVRNKKVLYVHMSQDQEALVARTVSGEREAVVLPHDYNVIDVLLENDVPVDVLETRNGDGGFLSWLPVIWQMVIFFFIFRFLTGGLAGGSAGGRGNPMEFLKSTSEVKEEPLTGVTFADVAGVENAKADLMEVVDFLKHPEKYTTVGAKVPKGVLLYGPPGTGKTLLAKAVAGEAGVPFLSASGSDFIEAFIGVGASRVRDLFRKASAKAPCIMFIDEIDTIGKSRGGSFGSPGNDERDQTINQLLTLMDGFEENNGVIVVAATNRMDILDDALLRPGRFDRKVSVELPDYKGRLAILKVHTRGRPLAVDVKLDAVSKICVGFSGADLQNLCNEASIYAARDGVGKLTAKHFDMAYEKITIGEEKKTMIVTKEKKKIVSYHEAGHALMALLVNNFDEVRKVSIIPRGLTGGITAFLPREDNLDGSLMSREYLENRIMVALGGRLAEELVFGWEHVTTGASGDIAEVYNMAYRMTSLFGMSRRLGPINLENAANKEDIQAEIHEMVEVLYAKARDMMKENEFYLHRLAEALMEKETLDMDDIEKCVYGMACVHRSTDST